MTTVTPGAEPVAWMYEAIKPRPDNEQLFVQTNRANMDPRYWTETPLYTTPPDALQTVVEALREIRDLHGEINPSNYDHDDACELNRQFVYALTIADQALAALSLAGGDA